MNRPIYVQRKGRRTEIAYKAQSPGKLTPRNKAQGSGDRVNATVVQGKFTLLNRVPSGKFNRVNILIRGDLSGFAFCKEPSISPVKKPVGPTGLPSPGTVRTSFRLAARKIQRNKGKQTGERISSMCQAYPNRLPVPI
jgi:hypothetical protein